MASLSTISSAATGAGGVLMAVPQLLGALGLGGKSIGNTIGYQPSLQNGLPFNPPALIFQYEGEQAVVLKSDITNHYAEDNTSLQDQIALPPITITTHGFIGELTDAPPNAVLQALQIAANKLSLVGGYVPELTVTAQLAYNTASFAYANVANLASSAVSAFSSITGNGGEAVVSQNGITNANGFANGQGKAPFLSSQGKQQLYFQQFYGYYAARTLFTVQTPWAVFTNMAIQTLRAIQEADTDMITDFEITFQAMRFASTGPQNATSGLAANPLGALASQIASPVTSAINLANSVPQPGF